MFSSHPGPAARSLLVAAAWAAALCGAPAGAAPPAATLSLDQAVRSATAQSSAIAAARALAAAAAEGTRSAAALPDPVLKLGVNNLPIEGPERFNVGAMPMTQRSVSLQQTFTRADKRSARVQRAERERLAALADGQAAAAALQRDTALAWLERSFREQTLALLHDQREPALQQVQAAEALYRGGRGSRADVFAARAQAELLDDRIAAAEREVAVATTRLARWVGAEATQPLAPRPALALPAWTSEDLPRHLRHHPAVAVADEAVAIADSEAAIADAARKPDWSAELTYSQRGSAYDNMVSFNVSVPLQWNRAERQDRDLAARLAAAEAARARRDDLLRQHEAEVLTLLQTWHSDAARLARYDAALLPLARQRSEAALTAYAAGSGGLPTVIEARQAVLELQLERLQRALDQALTWARIEYLQPVAETRP